MSFLLWTSIAIITVAGKLGDAAAPALLPGRPLLLLALNSSDAFVALTSALTSSRTASLVAFAVAALRRLAEDALFFAAGWRHGDQAATLLRAWIPWVSVNGDSVLLQRVR